MRHRALVAVLSAVAALTTGLAACGGPSTPVIVVTGPFTAEHGLAFDNAVDFIDDPTILEGSWLRSWEEDIDRRVQLADAIAVVSVSTLRTDVDLDRHETFRLVAHVVRERHGDLPEEVTLAVRQGDRGFETVRGNEERLLDHQFIAFLKWVDDEGRVVPRWHLSPAADRIFRRVNTLVERHHTAEEDQRRVIIREHSSGDEDDELEDDEF